MEHIVFVLGVVFVAASLHLMALLLYVGGTVVAGGVVVTVLL